MNTLWHPPGGNSGAVEERDKEPRVEFRKLRDLVECRDQNAGNLVESCGFSREPRTRP